MSPLTMTLLKWGLGALIIFLVFLKIKMMIDEG